MINICIFCGHLFMGKDINSQRTVEGHHITRIACGNCGAEFEFSMTIERGPTRKHITNGTSEHIAKQMTGGR